MTCPRSKLLKIHSSCFWLKHLFQHESTEWVTNEFDESWEAQHHPLDEGPGKIINLSLSLVNPHKGISVNDCTYIFLLMSVIRCFEFISTYKYSLM